MGEEGRFQSLTGRLKTRVGRIVHVVQIEFQSLTGRLKTRWCVDVDPDAVGFEFQSLTGRLKTHHLRRQNHATTRFQSLTGRLKTAALSDRQQAELVSIPHR